VYAILAHTIAAPATTQVPQKIGQQNRTKILSFNKKFRAENPTQHRWGKQYTTRDDRHAKQNSTHRNRLPGFFHPWRRKMQHHLIACLALILPPHHDYRQMAWHTLLRASDVATVICSLEGNKHLTQAYSIGNSRLKRKSG